MNAVEMAVANHRATKQRAPLSQKELRGYSLRHAIDNMAHEKRSGFESEISQDMERTHPATRGGLIVPWEVFTRSDTVGSVSQGGYLVGTVNLPAADALRPNMVAGALGPVNTNEVPRPRARSTGMP